MRLPVVFCRDGANVYQLFTVRMNDPAVKLKVL